LQNNFIRRIDKLFEKQCALKQQGLLKPTVKNTQL